MENTKCKDCEFAYAYNCGYKVPHSHVNCGVLSNKYEMMIMMPANTDSCKDFSLND